MHGLLVVSFLFGCVFAVSDAVPQQPTGRIVGGQSVNIEDYPYQVSVLEYGSHICGGSIITPLFIVTAAHCTDNTSPSALSIRAGSSIRNSGGTVIGVSVIYEHSLYNSSTFDYDISLLGLNFPLFYGSGIAPISLPELDQEVAAGSNSIVTGWGTLSETGTPSTQLQAVEMPIVSQAECRNSHGETSVTDRMICAGFPAGGKDSCQGDAGGPLVVDGQLIGVVSWGYDCGRPSYPGVYSSVPSMRTFIANMVGI